MNGLNRCAPEIYFDGALDSGARSEIITTMSADLIFGIEAYDRNAIPPPSLGGEFGGKAPTGFSTKKCGVVAVWTKAFVARMARAGKPPP
jgi:hypothetical protein